MNKITKIAEEIMDLCFNPNDSAVAGIPSVTTENKNVIQEGSALDPFINSMQIAYFNRNSGFLSVSSHIGFQKDIINQELNVEECEETIPQFMAMVTFCLYHHTK